MRADRLAHQLKNIFRDGGLLAAADRRKERDFVAIRERRAPAGVFLVHGCGDRRAKIRQLGEAAAVALEEIFDARAIGEIGLFLRYAGDFLQLPEKEDSHTHERILSRRCANEKRPPGTLVTAGEFDRPTQHRAH